MLGLQQSVLTLYTVTDLTKMSNFAEIYKKTN